MNDIQPNCADCNDRDACERVRMAQLAFEAYAFLVRANAMNAKLQENPYFYNAIESAKADFLERFELI